MDLVKIDLERGVKQSETTVFLDLRYALQPSNAGKCWKSKNGAKSEQLILSGASGALRPGRLTFILGPSGAGKTTLMKILAGRKKIGVTGWRVGAGRDAVLVPQHATLIDALTARETLLFASSLKLPNIPQRERNNTIDYVSKQLGIYEVLDTRAGRLSGGERKRLTVACELLTDPNIMLLDEPTSGLDSVSSMSLVRALHTVAASGRTVACVVHQPSSKLFASADDVLLMANGRTVYAGATADLPAALSRAGFICPQYYNLADFLLEIVTGEHNGNIAMLENEATCYADEMRGIARKDIANRNGSDLSSEAEALISRRSPYSETYAANFFQQLRSLLWRGGKGILRDVHLTQIRLVAHVVVALLLGALYNGAGDQASRVLSNTSCIFFFLLFLFFSNAMPTIHTFPVEATVVLQEHLNRWYWLTTYCISKILVDLPLQLLCATLFVIPAWFLTSQPMEIHRLGLAWVICVLITILAQTFGLVVGAACGVKLGLFVIPAANIPMLMFSEFFIPYHEMPVYLQPFAVISYFRYGFDALMQAVYGFDRPKLPCHQAYCMFKSPAAYLTEIGIDPDYVTDIWALLVWIWVLQISLVCVLAFKVFRACR